MLKNNHFLLIGFNLLFFAACSPTQKINRQAGEKIYHHEVFRQSHVGIYLYDPEKKKEIFNYQGEKYFVPASNTKIISCYAALKYLGTQIRGMDYWIQDTAVFLRATGDPTLLHPDFKSHPVADFLRQENKPLYLDTRNWKEQPLGFGWSWDDYNDDYMAERSPLPVYGNELRWHQVKTRKDNPQFPGDSIDTFIYTEPDITWEVTFAAPNPTGSFQVNRDRDANRYTVTEGKDTEGVRELPFVTRGFQSALELLKDTVHRDIQLLPEDPTFKYPELSPDAMKTVFSQSLDSFLRHTMYRSDNFYAEQALLMVSNQLLGYMNDRKVIDTLLKTVYKDFPQKPRWVDGSGLSRYNLFTPHDFVWVLEKMRTEFGWDRIKEILPAGGKGTLRNYYHSEVPFIYAKTGTLSGVVALSGFLITHHQKTLLFSVLVNNSGRSANDVRKQVEEFLTWVRDHF